MEADKENVKELAWRKHEENVSFFKKLKKKNPKNLDETVHRLHEEAFEQFDCLSCANCCSSISPIVTDKDVERLARFMKIKPAQFIERYLHLDEDHDYVFNDTPCPFLMPDNYCMVYEYRPKACREYPHTDRRRFIQLLNLTIQNCEVCPIVFNVVENLKSVNL
jgi:Fe-S-cluster containining protein